MAYTITDEEVKANKELADKIVVNQIQKYIRNVDTKPRISKKYELSVRNLCVYYEVLKTWQQGKYTNHEYTNFMDSRDYLELIKKINSYV